MAARTLAAYVYVEGQVYGPGSDVPAEIAEKITNPKAWGETPAPEAHKAPARKQASSKTEK